MPLAVVESCEQSSVDTSSIKSDLYPKGANGSIDSTESGQNSSGTSLCRSSPLGIGHVAMKNCTGVQFGPQTYYTGPVTIQQNIDRILLSEKENKKALKHKKRQKLALIVGCLLALLLVLLLSLSWYFISYRDPPEDATVNDDNLEVVNRTNWGARPSKEPLELQQLPADKVIICHTVNQYCKDTPSCSQIVKFIQDLHMDTNDWDDIGYHWIVGGNGAVFQGRDWGEMGSHTYGYNRRSIGIAFIGDFNQMKPTANALKAAQIMIERGVTKRYITEDYKLYGQCQLTNTESPGENLFDQIKYWPNWSNDKWIGSLKCTPP